jgi:hypothetical protein
MRRVVQLHCTIALIMASWAALPAYCQGIRTVRDTELGGIFLQNPAGPWTDYGAYIGVSSAYSASQFDPSALKANYTRFHVFRPSDETVWSYFPYSALRNYEAKEVAAGRPPIFVTATYNGKKRPVVWAWSLKLSNGVPTASSQDWEYAVNVGDDRFIKFWLNQYLRPLMWQSMYNVPNLWWGLDESAFLWSLYGVLDDNNRFVAGVPWDSPFPQNATAYATSITTFFSRVQTLAPDVRLMINVGSMDDPSQISTEFANVPGMLMEGYYERNPSAYTRNSWIPYFQGIKWFGGQNRPMVMRALIPSGDSVLNAFAEYEILKGSNFFFAPMYDGTGTAMPVSTYSQMDADLGTPLAAFQSKQVGSSIGYQLFWRMFDGGVVYLNWTGSTYTVTLPTDRVYYNTSGAAITQLTIADGAGAYARTTPLAKTGRPSISPRLGAPTQGPITVTITSPTTGASIYYTTDGSTPTTASRQYTGAFTLSSSGAVKAIAVASGYATSTVTTAAYTLTGAAPHVQFGLTSDSGVGGNVYPVLTLDAVPNGSAPVTVNYTVTQPGGSTSSGSVSFPPGDTTRYFPIQASTQANSTTTVKITSATNAALGTATQFTYTTGATSGSATQTGSGSTATMTGPTPGSALSGSSVTFTWSTGVGVSQYFLQVGTTGVGSFNLFSMPLSGTSQVVNGLPTSGTLYVRLYSNLGTATAVNWQYNDYTYSTSSGSTTAAMTTPQPGSQLSSTTTFSWTTGTGVSQYFLQVGTGGTGSFNVFSMPVSGASQTVSGIPTSGPVYVRLWSNLGTATAVNWKYVDYTYQSSGPSAATMSSPSPGAKLTGGAATFNWTSGVGVSQYFLQVGTTGAGSFNIFSNPVNSTTQIVNGLPASGTIYVRLWSNLGTATAVNWVHYDYTYIGG